MLFRNTAIAAAAIVIAGATSPLGPWGDTARAQGSQQFPSETYDAKQFPDSSFSGESQPAKQFPDSSFSGRARSGTQVPREPKLKGVMPGDNVQLQNLRKRPGRTSPDRE